MCRTRRGNNNKWSPCFRRARPDVNQMSFVLGTNIWRANIADDMRLGDEVPKPYQNRNLHRIMHGASPYNPRVAVYNNIIFMTEAYQFDQLHRLARFTAVGRACGGKAPSTNTTPRGSKINKTNQRTSDGESGTRYLLSTGGIK